MNTSQYIMIPEDHFAIVKFKPGIFTLEEAERINKTYKADIHYSDIHYLLIILTDCIPNFSQREIPAITDFYTNHEQTNNHIRSIWVIDAPVLTAFAHLFINNIQESSDFCSTLDKAYTLLNIPIPYKAFNSYIAELNKTT